MSVKKHRKSHPHSPFTAEVMAAMTKELPNVLTKEGYFKTEEQKKIESKPIESVAKPHTEPVSIPITIPQNPRIIPRGDRRALLYTVIFFSIFIFAIWLFNTRAIVADIWGENSSRDLVDQGKNDLNSILETIKQNDKIFQDRLNESDKTQAAVEEALKSIKNSR